VALRFRNGGSRHAGTVVSNRRNGGFHFAGTAVLSNRNIHKELDSFKNELFNILSDGIVTPDEIERLKDILINLDKVQEIVNVIKDMVNEQVYKLDNP